ncbi:MAG: polysaccharide biosynthesis/export family protein [Deltaproteobacteria bacterium]|nr:polysaccharide biosynthesis/export family protein [Deltaproteobacteria bacterium]
MNRCKKTAFSALCLILLLAVAGCGLLGGAVVKTITPEAGADTVAGLSQAEREALAAIKKSSGCEGESAAATDYRVGGNDVLNIMVYDERELRSPGLRVTPDGYISFPLIGRIKVAGLTTSQIEELIAQKLARGYLVDPHVSVQVEEFDSRYYVIGEVKRPGAYPLGSSDISLVEGIGFAGGFTNFAARNSTKIIRNHNGREIAIRVKVDDIMKAGTQLRDIILQPNDIIIVPQSFF